MERPRLAKDIIDEALLEVAPSLFELLRKIINIEDVHLTDKGTTTTALVTAEIERAAKPEETLG